VEGGAPERVSLVDLTAVRDPASVPAHLSSVVAAESATGEPAVDRIVSAIGDKQYLLLVDNCEHVLDAVPVLATLLARCPRLRILGTSRDGCGWPPSTSIGFRHWRCPNP
jgi:predicted ATPase